MNKQRIKEQLMTLQKCYSDSLVAIGRIMEALEEEDTDPSAELSRIDLNGLLEMYRSNSYHYDSNSKKYGAYKKPETAPDLIKGPDLMALIKDAEALGVFETLGLEDSPSSSIGDLLLEESDKIRSYVRIMNEEGRQFYLLKPQKILLEKIIDNEIIGTSNKAFINKFKMLLGDVDTVGGIPEHVFLKAFWAMRLEYPTLDKYVKYDSYTYGKRKVVFYILGRTKSELKRIMKGEELL